MNDNDRTDAQFRRDRAPGPRKGRGAVIAPTPRYSALAREAFDDGWEKTDEALPPLDTRIREEQARSLLTRNESPDVPFDQSVNPYRGCEHGCVYCFARPSHAWLDLSPGLDFERLLSAKVNAAERLRQELSARGYRCRPIAIGASTDAYQPIERRYRLTRALLELMVETRHPCTLITKSALIERDLDLLVQLASDDLVEVHVSLTTLDSALARRMEPRATAPARRVEVIRRLVNAGVPTSVIVAPIIPGLTDQELERILEMAAAAGAQRASYVVLRLPLEISPMFKAWLEHHYPLKSARVMNLMRGMHGGKDYDSDFAHRMTGQGPLAMLLARRFETASRRLGLAMDRRSLATTHFHPPAPDTPQFSLF